MKVLVADDNPFYLCALTGALRDLGYEAITASDGAQAWKILQSDESPKLAILDWEMPHLDGLEVCRRVRAMPRAEPIFIIMLTAKEGKENTVTALDSGADDFLSKPFNHQELRARLRVGARIVGLQTSQTVVFAFAQAVEAKSPYTQGHAERVTRYALALAQDLAISATELEVLRRGALLHDIGKISVPDAILNKPGPLTPEEYDIIKQHPGQGVKIVEPLGFLHDVIPLIRWHHERLDGRGYPDGLVGKDIPMLVRILSVADVFDSLASERPYRPALSREKCLDILQTEARGGGLDPALVERFCRLAADSNPRGSEATWLLQTVGA